MVNNEELIVTTEHLTLYTRCCINRCRYKRVRLYLCTFVGTIIVILILDFPVDMYIQKYILLLSVVHSQVYVLVVTVLLIRVKYTFTIILYIRLMHGSWII